MVIESESEECPANMPFMTTTFGIDRNGSEVWWTAAAEYCDADGREIDRDSQVDDIIIHTFNNKIFPTGIVSYVSAQG